MYMLLWLMLLFVVVVDVVVFVGLGDTMSVVALDLESV